MDRQLTGSTPALRRQWLSRAGLAAAVLMRVASASAAAAWAQAPITMVLPSRVAIALASGQTISGVRLMALGLSEVSYEKGGRRSLPLREVKSISFSGSVSLEAKLPPEIRGAKVEGCRGPRLLLISGSALVVQSNGDALALNPASLERTVSRDLRQASSLNFLVVDTLRFEPDGKVRLTYNSCSPAK